MMKTAQRPLKTNDKAKTCSRSSSASPKKSKDNTAAALKGVEKDLEEVNRQLLQISSGGSGGGNNGLTRSFATVTGSTKTRKSNRSSKGNSALLKTCSNVNELHLLEQRLVLMTKLKQWLNVVEEGYKVLGRKGPNPIAYKCIIASLCRVRKLDEVKEVLDQWKRNSPKCPQMQAAKDVMEGFLTAIRSGMDSQEMLANIEDVIGIDTLSPSGDTSGKTSRSRNKKTVASPNVSVTQPRWTFRPPPQRHNTFSLCSRVSSGVTCIYGNDCLSAHSKEELKEWQQRHSWNQNQSTPKSDCATTSVCAKAVALNNATTPVPSSISSSIGKSGIAREEIPFIYRALPPACMYYLAALAKQVKEAKTIKSVLVDALEDVKIRIAGSPNQVKLLDPRLLHNTELDTTSAITHKWTLMIASKRPLATVTLLNDNCREFYAFTGAFYFNSKRQSIDLVDLHPNNKSQKGIQVLNTFIRPEIFLPFNNGWPDWCCYQIDVTFYASCNWATLLASVKKKITCSQDGSHSSGQIIVGKYEQNVILDFKGDPKICKQLSFTLQLPITPSTQSSTPAVLSSPIFPNCWSSDADKGPAKSLAQIVVGTGPRPLVPSLTDPWHPKPLGFTDPPHTEAPLSPNYNLQSSPPSSSSPTPNNTSCSISSLSDCDDNFNSTTIMINNISAAPSSTVKSSAVPDHKLNPTFLKKTSSSSSLDIQDNCDMKKFQDSCQHLNILHDEDERNNWQPVSQERHNLFFEKMHNLSSIWNDLEPTKQPNIESQTRILDPSPSEPRSPSSLLDISASIWSNTFVPRREEKVNPSTPSTTRTSSASSSYESTPHEDFEGNNLDRVYKSPFDLPDVTLMAEAALAPSYSRSHSNSHGLIFGSEMSKHNNVDISQSSIQTTFAKTSSSTSSGDAEKQLKSNFPELLNLPNPFANLYANYATSANSKSNTRTEISEGYPAQHSSYLSSLFHNAFSRWPENPPATTNGNGQLGPFETYSRVLPLLRPSSFVPHGQGLENYSYNHKPSSCHVDPPLHKEPLNNFDFFKELDLQERRDLVLKLIPEPTEKEENDERSENPSPPALLDKEEFPDLLDQGKISPITSGPEWTEVKNQKKSRQQKTKSSSKRGRKNRMSNSSQQQTLTPLCSANLFLSTNIHDNDEDEDDDEDVVSTKPMSSEEMMDSLKEMGFEKKKISRALKHCDQDFERAIEWLILHTSTHNENKNGITHPVPNGNK